VFSFVVSIQLYLFIGSCTKFKDLKYRSNKHNPETQISSETEIHELTIRI